MNTLPAHWPYLRHLIFKAPVRSPGASAASTRPPGTRNVNCAPCERRTTRLASLTAAAAAWCRGEAATRAATPGLVAPTTLLNMSGASPRSTVIRMRAAGAAARRARATARHTQISQTSPLWPSDGLGSVKARDCRCRRKSSWPMCAWCTPTPPTSCRGSTIFRSMSATSPTWVLQQNGARETCPSYILRTETPDSSRALKIK